MSLVFRFFLAAVLLSCIQAFFGGAVESLATPRCISNRCSRRSFSVVDGSGLSGRVAAFVPGATDTTTTQKQQPHPQQPYHLFKRGSGTEDSAAWYDHVVKQGVTLALPAIVMLSVVTTPIMVINPQPVHAAAAAATKDDITMLTNKIDALATKTETKNMFDTQKTEITNKFDAQNNKIDALDNKYAYVPVWSGVAAAVTAVTAGIINYLAILDVKKDTKEVAKQVVADEGAKILQMGVGGAFILAFIYGLLATVKSG